MVLGAGPKDPGGSADAAAESLPELEKFIEFLRFKSEAASKQEAEPGKLDTNPALEIVKD